jgi:hypothetical protein
MFPRSLDLTEKNGIAIYRGVLPYFVEIHFDTYDFSGCTGKSQVKDRSGNLLFEFDVTFPETDVCRISYADTEPLEPVRGARWDLFITYANGDVRPELAGLLDITDRVTDRD